MSARVIACVLLLVIALCAFSFALGAWAEQHQPLRHVCALTRTVDDVAWRDASGVSHDWLPLCVSVDDVSNN